MHHASHAAAIMHHASHAAAAAGALAGLRRRRFPLLLTYHIRIMFPLSPSLSSLLPTSSLRSRSIRTARARAHGPRASPRPRRASGGRSCGLCAMIPAMIPRPMPRALPWHWTHGQADCSSLDTAHARRLCARTGLDPGQKCIYCDTRCATSILWPFGGGAACFTCTDTARSRGLQGLDLVRVDRWLQSLCWSKTGRWKTVLAPSCVGHLIAPYMVHLHQNRGNTWMRLVGWTTLYPSPDPAPAWRAAVAAHGGLADASVAAHGGLSEDGLGKVCRIVDDCQRLAETATNSLPFALNSHLPGRTDGPPPQRTDQQARGDEVPPVPSAADGRRGGLR